MLTDFDTLDPGAPLARAIELTLAGSQQDFPVARGTTLCGILTQEGMLKGLQAQGESVPVSAVMQEEVTTADGHEFVVDVLPRFGEGGLGAIPVTQGGELVGLLTMTNVHELLQIRSALERARRHPARGPSRRKRG